jgi:hypothetical protein
MMDMLGVMQRDRGRSPSEAGGTAQDHVRPSIVHGLPPVVQVAAGEDFSLVLAGDHSVWGWGDNLYGELGDGTWENHPSPVRAHVPVDVTEIAAGNSHVVAVAADGTLYTWGFGAYGQLGAGRAERRLSTPTPVPGLSLKPMILGSDFQAFGPKDTTALSPIARWSNDRVQIHGVAPSAYGYVASFTPVRAGAGTAFREFVVEGDVKTGGITVGLQSQFKWVYYQNFNIVGPFTMRWVPPAPGEYAVVVAHFAEQPDRKTDIDLLHVGWLRAGAAGSAPSK